MLNAFDAYGRLKNLDNEADRAAIEALPDDHREKLFACIAAVTARDAGEARVVAARRDVRAKETIYNSALERNHAANPPTSHKAALERVIEANAGRPMAPVKANRKTRAALADAEMVLTDARRELTAATGELRTLETKAGAAINAWRLCATTPTADEVRRQYIAAGDDERVRRVAAGLPAEIPRPVPKHQSELDRVFAARGKTANRTPAYHGNR